MAKLEQVALQYSNAIYDLASENNKLNVVFEDLYALSKIFKENDDLIFYLTAESVDNNEIIETLSKNADEITKNLLKILDKNKRFNLLQIIVDQFIHRYNVDRGHVQATAVTAIALTDEQIERLKNIFIQKTGVKSVDFENIVDQSIIGGVILKSDSFLIDGSIKSKIEKLKKQLAN